MKLAKKNNKDQRKLKQDRKSFSKIKYTQFTYKKCLVWPVTGRVRYKEGIM